MTCLGEMLDRELLMCVRWCYSYPICGVVVPALRIHLSSATKEVLDEFGYFDLQLRGDIEMKVRTHAHTLTKKVYKSSFCLPVFLSLSNISQCLSKPRKTERCHNIIQSNSDSTHALNIIPKIH